MQHDRSLERRIDDLERRCRRLRLWCIASSAGLLGACLAGATSSPPKVLRAEQFLLVAPDGRTAGDWSADEVGAQLAMTAADGACSVLLAAREGEVQEGKLSFRFEGGDGGDAQVESDFQVERTRPVPFAGLMVSSAAQEGRPDTLVHVGTGLQEGAPGFQVQRGETLAWLQALDAGALLHLEGGDATFGALTANAFEGGAVVSVCWSDELAANLAATPERTGLSIDTAMNSDADEEDLPAALEVIADERRSPVVRIRDAERVVFEAP